MIVAAWIQALEATPELASITMDEICQAEAADESPAGSPNLEGSSQAASQRLTSVS